MTSRITRSKFDNLKRRAARLKRSAGLTHAQALDHVAKEEGFENWSLLAPAVEPVAAPVPAAAPANPAVAKPHHVRLSGFVRSRPGEAGDVFHEYVPSLHPAKHYAKLGRGRPYWQEFVGRAEGGLRDSIATTRRGIEFMDATGLRRSEAWIRVFGHGAIPDGFDHTSVWMDARGLYLVATEPYIGSDKGARARAWCEAKGWRAAQLPRGFGIWNPCRNDCAPDCGAHTTMILMVPPKRGADLAATVAAVKANAP